MTRFIAASWWFNRIRARRELVGIQAEFDDPVTALQDSDFDLPPAVKLTFYSAHNLMDELLKGGKTAFGNSHVYVAINQAVDALEHSGLMSDKSIANWIQAAEG